MSYCDFKVGDEVVCIKTPPLENHRHSIREGCIYVVRAVSERGWFPEPSIDVGEVTASGCTLWTYAKYFSKAQRRDLSQWLSQSTDLDEEQRFPAPKAPAKKREAV